MADYEFRYSLERAPEPHVDGSGMVKHEIRGVARVEGSGDNFSAFPGLPHKTINIPAEDLLTVLAMQHGADKINAYKDLIRANVNTINVAPNGNVWDMEVMEQVLDGNDTAADAASQADEYITVTVGADYPVRFNL